MTPALQIRCSTSLKFTGSIALLLQRSQSNSELSHASRLLCLRTLAARERVVVSRDPARAARER